MEFSLEEGLLLHGAVPAAALLGVMAGLFWRYPRYGLALMVLPYFITNGVLVANAPIHRIMGATAVIMAAILYWHATRSGRQLVAQRSRIVLRLALVNAAYLVAKVLAHTEVIRDLYDTKLVWFLAFGVIPVWGAVVLESREGSLRRAVTSLTHVTLGYQALILIRLAAVAMAGASFGRLRHTRVLGVGIFAIATCTVFSVLWAVSFIVQGKSRRMWAVPVMGVGLLLVVVSGTRVLWAAAPLSILLIAAHRWRVRAWLGAVFVTCIGGLLIVMSGSKFVETVGAEFSARMESTMAARDLEEVSSGRSELLSYAIDRFAENPIWGVRLGESSPLQLRSADGGGMSLQRVGVHNQYVEILAEQGIVGTLPMIATILIGVGLFFSRVWRRDLPTGYPVTDLARGLFVFDLVVMITAGNVNIYLPVALMAIQASWIDKVASERGAKAANPDV